MDRIEKIKEFLQTTPEDNFLRHALALEYIKQGKDAEAKKIFETILDRDPGYVGSYYHFALLLNRIGENEKAISICKKGMDEAKKIKDEKAYNELKSLNDDLI